MENPQIDKLELLMELIRELPDIASLSTLEEGRFIEVNDILLETIGYAREEVIGRTSLEIGLWVNTDDRSRLTKALIDSNFILKSIELDFKSKNGSIINTLLSAKKFEIDGKRYMLNVFKNVTDFRKTMHELNESNKRFEALLEASFGGIAIHDKGLILIANKGLSDITGYSGKELIGIGGLTLIAPEWRDLVFKHIIEGYEKPYEAMGLRKDGTTYHLHIQGKQIPYHGQQVRVTEFRDLTEQKQNEQKHRKLEEQLYQIQKLDSIGTLVGGIAHDFNNILTVIQGQTELAEMKLSKNLPITDSLAEIRKGVQFASDLTRNLLTFSRKQICQPKVIDINSVISNLYKILSRVIKESITINLSLSKNIYPVLADAHQIEQILMNLVINASDAIAAAEKSERIISIETVNAVLDERFASTHPAVSPGRHIILSVSDDGIGMDKEIVTRIFEPFFTTKNRGEGTGLGLSTVYGIVTQNRGIVDVYSEKNKGSAFKIFWPAAESPAEEEIIPAAPELTLRGSETVLLVEDNLAVRSFAREILETNGYTVISASNGREALGIVADGLLFDLLLTDVVMPEMNGPELAEQVMKIKSSAKILYVSGYTENYIIQNCILDSNISFLPKPYTAEMLGKKIRELLDGKTQVT